MLTGVSFNAARGLWRARVSVGGKRVSLGYARSAAGAEQLIRDHMSGDFTSETHLLAGKLGYSLQQTADLLERCRAAALTPPRPTYDPSLVPMPSPPPIPSVPAVRASTPPLPPSFPAPPPIAAPVAPTPNPVTIRYESLDTASLIVFGALTYGPMPLDEAENRQFAAVVRNLDRLTPAVRYDTLTGMWTDGDEWAPDLDTLLIDATVKPV